MAFALYFESGASTSSTTPAGTTTVMYERARAPYMLLRPFLFRGVQFTRNAIRRPNPSPQLRPPISGRTPTEYLKTVLESDPVRYRQCPTPSGNGKIPTMLPDPVTGSTHAIRD